MKVTDAKLRNYRKPNPDAFMSTGIVSFLHEQYITEQKRKLVLESWQLDNVLKPLFYDLDENGLRKYRIALIGVPKKNGKSTFAASIGIYMAYCDEIAGEVIVAANDKDQASQIIYTKMRRAINYNAELKAGVNTYKGFIEIEPRDTTIRCIANEFESAAGLNPNCTLFDELWGFKGRKFYDELTVVPTRTQPLIVIVTYAGYEQSGLLWDLYSDGMAGETLMEIPGKEVYIKRAKSDKRMFMLWSHDNLSKWVADDYLEDQKRRLPPPVYARLHENRWVSQVGTIITQRDIDRILNQYWRPQFAPNVEKAFSYVMACDVGLSNDRTVVAVTHYDPEDQRVYLDSLRLWEGSQEEHVLIEGVERYMFEEAEKFRVSCIVCDPWQLEASMQKLRGIYQVRAFNFATDMIRLSQVVHNLVTSGGLQIYNCSELIDELKAAIVKQTPRGWKLEHTKHGHNDCLVTVGMAALECVESQAMTPTIYY